MISFVIPAHNEERLIGQTLSALRAAALAVNEPHEIIVANDASSDATAAVAAAHGARVLSVAHRQIAGARNSGAREATGDLLVFVDADTIVSEAVVRAALEAVRNGAVGGGAASCGFYEGCSPELNPRSCLVPAEQLQLGRSPDEHP